MHWFWRGLLTFVAVDLVTWLLVIGSWLATFHSVPQQLRNEMKSQIGTDLLDNLTGSAFTLAFTFLGIGVWTALTRRYGPSSDRETRCRKCQYILRGITEPRCPECGERI